MNKKEQSLLLRISEVLRCIPGCNIGVVSNQSANISGAITFAKDISMIKEPLETALFHLRLGEYEEAEQILSAIEEWINIRQEHDWKEMFPFPKVEI